VHLLSIPPAVSATGYEKLERGIDIIQAELHYPSIGSVVVTGGWHHPKAYPFSMEFTVVADGGTLDYSSDGRPLALYRSDGEKQILDSGDADWFTEELKYFVDCAAHGLKAELCPPQESALAVKLARLMVESRERNGEKIPCSL